MKGEAFTLPLNKRNVRYENQQTNKGDEIKQNQKDTIRMELKRLMRYIVAAGY